MKNNFATVKFIFLSVIIFTCNSCIDDIDDNLKPIDFASLIKADDDLGKLIDKVVNEREDPMLDIVCIDFVYPLTLLVYNENRQVTGTQTLGGDDEFSTFLGSLTDSQLISISYPISATLADGNTFSINNNQELKIAIESCSREDIVRYCSDLFCGSPTCVWQVLYSENHNNEYSSGVFKANADGTINFNFNEQNYLGTWTFLFFNDEFQININLEGTSSVANYWNFSKKVELNGDTTTILNDSGPIILSKKCEVTTVYTIGDEGVAGGIVFYDKGFYSNGWRYIEASSTDLVISEWGCSSTLTEANSIAIGAGFYNSTKTANFHDNLQDYYANPAMCNELNDGTVISKTALAFNSEDYKDWFLPSEQELLLIYENLYLQNIGDFANGNYWSSSEIDTETAKGINFETGEIIVIYKNPTVPTNARAIRYF
jgi:hypothetical protein